MVRVIIKGGVWRNTEDEILKAAISKYGKNQWARISSLLVRKTPKQCKARWYEWLDPSIKKVEWSKTEDEKLLHLAKLMPTQWRTIAPIVGRTATQCLERYQKLLDDAENAENEELGLGDGENESSKPAIGGLRVGEIDTDPETRPARPDPVDMDDDEKEMLSEARARLANTQGKKAKRKARERQLEEARRVAFLQKKRELKAAGINLRQTKKRKGMDYNEDIPFEKQPMPGFYDTAEEKAKTYAPLIGHSLKSLDGKRRQELEEAEAKEAKRRKTGEDKDKAKPGSATAFVQQREAQIRKLKEQERAIRRKALNLPTPQVGEAELEEIVKIGQAGEAAKELVGTSGGATDQLVGEYENLKQARMARTPQVASASGQDTILAEARNLRNMSSVQTPLLGEENTPLHEETVPGGGYSGATPRHSVASTPNPLATPARGAMATPRGLPGATPLRTPRDNLALNTPAGAGWGETPADDRRRMKDARRALKAGFASLPKPENNFELTDEVEEDEEEDEGVALTEEDAAERDARLKAAREEEERLELARRSQVVKKGLPRPANVDERAILRQLNSTLEDVDASLTAAINLINVEMAQLMKHDSLAHPVPGSSSLQPSQYDMPEDEHVASAKSLIHAELAGALGLPGANEEQVRRVIGSQVEETQDAFADSWSEIAPKFVYLPGMGWVDPADLSPEQRRQAYSAMIGSSKDRMIASATKATKAEKKLSKQLGGYNAINAKTRASILSTMEEIQQAQRDLETFEMLKSMEMAAIPSRIEQKRMEVEKLERRERDLQAKYGELNDERRRLLESIEGLEEDKVVLEAQIALEAQENGA